MAVKRRTIWMSDDDWAKLGRVVDYEQARGDRGLGQKITASLVIRDCLDRGHFRVMREREEPPPLQALLDAASFTEFRPAPKLGKGK